MRKSSLIIPGLLVLFGIAVMMLRYPLFLRQKPPPPQPQGRSSETALFSDPIPQAEDVTTRGFQSGGLGLSRTAWEMLRGKPRRVGKWLLYQGQTYSVSYQQDIIWQLKCAWKRPGLELAQARTRARRYLPLDSRHQYTIMKTPTSVVDLYSSRTLTQLLAQTVTADTQTQRSLGQQGTYTVTHTLEKDRVIATHFQIKAGLCQFTPSEPKPEAHVTTTPVS
jgi:hypothetical protein